MSNGKPPGPGPVTFMVLCGVFALFGFILGIGLPTTMSLLVTGLVGSVIIDRADRKRAGQGRRRPQVSSVQVAMLERGRANALRDTPDGAGVVQPPGKGPLVRTVMPCPACKESGWSASGSGRPCACCDKAGMVAAPRGWKPEHGYQGLIPSRSARLDYKVIADLEFLAFGRTFPSEGAPCLHLPGCNGPADKRDHRCLAHPPDWDAATDELPAALPQPAAGRPLPAKEGEQAANEFQIANQEVVDAAIASIFATPPPIIGGHLWTAHTYNNGDRYWRCCKLTFSSPDALNFHLAGPVSQWMLGAGNTSMTGSQPSGASHSLIAPDIMVIDPRDADAYEHPCTTCGAERMAHCRDRRPGLMGRQCKRVHAARRKLARKRSVTITTERLP